MADNRMCHASRQGLYIYNDENNVMLPHGIRLGTVDIYVSRVGSRKSKKGGTRIYSSWPCCDSVAV